MPRVWFWKDFGCFVVCGAVACVRRWGIDQCQMASTTQLEQQAMAAQSQVPVCSGMSLCGRRLFVVVAQGRGSPSDSSRFGCWRRGKRERPKWCLREARQQEIMRNAIQSYVPPVRAGERRRMPECRVAGAGDPLQAGS